jgi:hypothetical protein
LVKLFEELSPKAQLNLIIMKDEMAMHFIKTMQDFSEKELGKKDAFVYQVM